MADDTESTQRNPLSSSSSTPSGTQALGITIERERETDETAQAGDENTPAPSGRRDLTQPVADNENDPASQLTASTGDENEVTTTEPADAEDAGTEGSDSPSSDPAAELQLSQGEAAGDVISKPNEMPEANDDAAASMEDAFVSEEPTASVAHEPGANHEGEATGMDMPQAAAAVAAEQVEALSETTDTAEAQHADSGFDQPIDSQDRAAVEDAHAHAFSGVWPQGEEALAPLTQMSQQFGSAMKDAQSDAAFVSSRMMEFARANFQNNVEMVQNYAAARSLPDLFNAHTTYFKRQMELLNQQASALRALTTEIATRNARKIQGQDEPE